MKLYYCNDCKRINDPKEILDERCSICGKIKTGQEVMPAEYSDVDQLIINQNIYNMIFGNKE
jgi:DNA-directed RNA polymerase subunit RPC12/RpoP